MHSRLWILGVLAILLGSAAFAGVPGTYVDGSPGNITSATNPWYMTGAGTWDDNLWAYRQDWGWGSTVFEAGPSVGYSPWVEDVPVITMGTDVLQGSYKVYLVYWTHLLVPEWSLYARISGADMNLYDGTNGVETGLKQSDGTLIQRYALLGTVENVNRIEVDVDGPDIMWMRGWFDGIAYESTGQHIDISGTYVDATTANTSSTANPWYVEGGGAWGDNLWAARSDYGIGNTVFEAGPPNYEDAPRLTTEVAVAKGCYKVYVYFWSHKDAWWGIGAAIHGRPLQYYWNGPATPTGLTQQDGNLIHLKAYLGDAIWVDKIKVDVDNVYWPEDRTWYDGISYEVINVSIKGEYVDAAPENTTSDVNPYYVAGGGAFDDNLWALRNESSVVGVNQTSF